MLLSHAPESARKLGKSVSNIIIFWVLNPIIFWFHSQNKQKSFPDNSNYQVRMPPKKAAERPLTFVCINLFPFFA